MTRAAAAALVAIICWAGLAVQFSATFADQHHVASTLWILLRYFTVITNLAVALAMTWEAVGGRLSATLLGGLTLAILLVGVVYVTMLRGLVELSGGAVIADILLHKVSPAAMALWWLFFAPRARLNWSDALWWGRLSARLFRLRPRTRSCRRPLSLSLHRRRQTRTASGCAQRGWNCAGIHPRRPRISLDRRLAPSWVKGQEAIEAAPSKSAGTI